MNASLPKSAASVGLIVAMLVGVTAANANPLTFVPTGLSVGDHYRLVFVTGPAAVGVATSTDIATYNAFVSAAAPSVPGGATWTVIGSTASVSALANIGGVDNTPIYDLQGNLVADGTFGAHGLFNSAAVRLDFGIQWTPEGNLWNNSAVFTGTNADGSIRSGFELGNATHVSFGASGRLDANYLTLSNFPNGVPPTTQFDFYAISADRVVTGDDVSMEDVPEPVSVGLFVGGVIGVVAARRRKRA